MIVRDEFYTILEEQDQLGGKYEKSYSRNEGD